MSHIQFAVKFFVNGAVGTRLHGVEYVYWPEQAPSDINKIKLSIAANERVIDIAWGCRLK